ncbi:helix-turn-helix domain-containing protein [Achromobacter sp. NPDC058515]|uniref:helix-turn-helix domain-containing protein n=1 Tax=Achromobacter sp. NPDC058515 TaxID=3346533 RepID=UPI00364C5AF4
MEAIMQHSLRALSPRPLAHIGLTPIPPRRTAALTSSFAHPIRNRDQALPEPVQTLIVHRHISAFRAWRTHQGLSMRAVQQRTRMPIATLMALDGGEVALCEWTVEPLAKALGLDASQLLKAELLARLNRPETITAHLR